jgi:hypothetical protein
MPAQRSATHQLLRHWVRSWPTDAQKWRQKGLPLGLSQNRLRQCNRHKCNQNLHNLGRLPPLP